MNEDQGKAVPPITDEQREELEPAETPAAKPAGNPAGYQNMVEKTIDRTVQTEKDGEKTTEHLVEKTVDQIDGPTTTKSVDRTKETKTTRTGYSLVETTTEISTEKKCDDPDEPAKAKESARTLLVKFRWALGAAIAALVLALITLAALVALDQQSRQRDQNQSAAAGQAVTDGIKATDEKLAGQKKEFDSKINKLAGPKGSLAKLAGDLKNLEGQTAKSAETARQNRVEDQNKVLWMMIRDIRQHAPESDIAKMTDEDLRQKLINGKIDIEPQIVAAHQALNIPESATAEQLEQVRTSASQAQTAADGAASAADNAGAKAALADAKADLANKGVNIVANGKKTCFKGLPTKTTRQLQQLIADNPCLQPAK